MGGAGRASREGEYAVTAASDTGDLDEDIGAVEAPRQSVRANLSLAETLVGQGKLAEAQEIYVAVLSDRPTNFRALIGLSELRLRRGEVSEAEVLLDRAKSAAGSDAAKLLRIGTEFRKAGRKQKAEAAFEAALVNASGALKARAQQALASLGGESEEPRSRISALDATLSSHPDDPGIKLRLALALCRGEPDWSRRGRAQYAGHSVTPSNAIVRAKALAHDASIAGIPIQQTKALALLGEIARFEGHWQEALDRYRKAAESQPADPELQVEVGNALRDLSILNDAQAAYQKALALDPNCVAALIALGDLEKLQDHNDKAADYYNRAAALDPANLNVPTALRRLQVTGEAFDWQDEIRRAIDAVQDEGAGRGFLAGAATLLQYGLTEYLSPVLPRLEAVPGGRQIAAAARELDRAGLSQTLDAKRTGYVGTDADLNEVRGSIEKPVPNAESLVIVFAGSTRLLGGVEFSLLHRFIQRIGASAIYVRDIRESRYLQGIVGLGDNFDSTVRALREKQETFGAKRLMTIGTCPGAAAAMRYGLAAGAEAVLGIHPNIGAPATEKLKPVDVERVEKFRALHSDTKPLKELYADAAERPAVTLIYSDHHEPYTSRVRELAVIPGITLVGIANTQYPTTRALLAANLLEPVLRQFIDLGSLTSELADRVRNIGPAL